VHRIKHFSVTVEKISIPSASTSRGGGQGTGSATIISSTEVEDESVSVAESGGADSTQSEEAEVHWNLTGLIPENLSFSKKDLIPKL
jgi:hypothetical protein